MQISDIKINFVGEKMLLNNGRSIFWERHQMLIIADLHIGKTAVFRQHGISIPSGMQAKDLTLLKKLIRHYAARKILIAGDLFHGGNNQETIEFFRWIKTFNNVKWSLVSGNHDLMSDIAKNDGILNIIPHKALIDPITFIHQPTKDNIPHICGHIHPGVLIRHHSFQTIKLPCFLVSDKQIILPAFSQMTGLDIRFTQSHKGSFDVYAVTEKSVIEIDFN